MTTIIWIRNAELILESENVFLYYLFDEGYLITIRCDEPSEHTLTIDTTEALIEDAKEMIDSGYRIESGEVPGWKLCSYCEEEWLEYNGNMEALCQQCDEWRYNHSG